MSRIPKTYEIYKHFKGKLYQVLAVAEHSETGEQLVVYQALYGTFQIYARPLDSFLSAVDKEKYPDAMQNFRFELCMLQAEPDKVTQTVQTEPDKAVQAMASVAKSEPMKAQPMMTESAEVDRPVEQREAQALEPEEPQIDPIVLQFLEAESYEERLNILVGFKHRITDEMITTMAVASDVEVPEGSLEERFLELKNCLSTLDKYECSRLR